MIFEELLQGYLDGTLGAADQAELFHIMAVSDEKRAAFNDSMQLRARFAADRAVTQVPATLASNTLRAALEFVSPAAATVAPVAQHVATGLFAGRFVLPFLVSSGLLISAGVGYFIGHRDAPVAQQSTAAQVTNSVVAPAVVPQTHAVAGDERSEGAGTKVTTETAVTLGTAARAQAAAPRAAVIAHRAPNDNVATAQSDNTPEASPVVERVAAQATQPTAAVTAPEEPASPAIGRVSDSHMSIVAADQRGLNTGVSARPEMIMMFGSSPLFDQAFDFELAQGTRMFHNAIDAGNLAGPPTMSLFQIRAGIYLTDNLSVGLTAGQNAFALKYTDEPDAMTRRAISQYSSMMYGGVYARQEFSPILGLTPALTLGGGAGTLGPLAEMQLSVSHPLGGIVRAFAGLQTQALFYQHAGNWFGSYMTSFTAGIGVAL